MLQGTVLAQTLFTLHINDLLNKIYPISSLVAYVDDNYVYHDGNPTKAAFNVANDIELISEGSVCSLRKRAAQFLIRHFLRRYYHLLENFWLEILIHGVICPHNLKWSSHDKHTHKQITSMVGVLTTSA